MIRRRYLARLLGSGLFVAVFVDFATEVEGICLWSKDEVGIRRG